MRIVYVLTSLGMGGAERQVLELAGRMAQRGHTVVVLALRPGVADEWPTRLNVVHLAMRRSPRSVLAGVARGRRFLQEFHPDLVHSHSFHANLVARLLKVLVPSIPVLSTVHNVYEGGWARMLAYRLTDGLARRTVAVSKAAADRFVRLKAIPRHKCMVMPNGIDTAAFTPDAERREEKRIAMGAGSAFIWLAVGRIVPAKDYPTLLRAFAQVRAARGEARLWVAGAETSVVEAARVRALTAESGLEDAVRWLGLCRDLPALLDAADAFVLASAWEGMPLAVGEAMAMEKPVVATDAGGVRELVGDAGAIVPVRAPDALAAAMLHLMQSTPEERRALGRAARERVEKLFSMDTRADEWEELYRTILKDL
ncbi:MAG: GT4 family glycosyltransferase PelF [Terracidiphilus sp.]|nr:GT4 family glycosyltransferase PelF [Terracidiphilus sp.]